MGTIRPALVLFAVISVSAFLIGVMYNITRGPIAQQQLLRETELIAEVLPGTVYVWEMPMFGDWFESFAPAEVTSIVQGLDEQGNLLGHVFTISTPGYAGPVVILVGSNMDNILTGVRILRHRETPGLGTAIQGADFLAQFEGRTETITVSRMASGENEIAALASATISTVAVVNGVNAAIEMLESFGIVER